MDKITLYICGNGFDLFHGYKSSYYDYREYLINLFPRIVHDYENFGFIKANPSDRWSDVEMGLTLEYEEINQILKDDKDFEYELESLTSFIYDFTGKYFVEWLLKVCEHNPAKMITFEKNCIFINFNYTNTLEKIYAMEEERIFHIHGYIEKVDGTVFSTRDIVPSHVDLSNFESMEAANVFPSYKFNNDITKGEIQFGSVYNHYNEFDKYYENQKKDIFYTSSDVMGLSACADFCQAAYKNLKVNYNLLTKFISKEIEKIIVLGHSIMGVDFDYYRDILIPILGDKKWEIYCFSDNDNLKAEEFIDFFDLKNAEIKKWNELKY